MKKGQVYEGIIEKVEFPNKGIVPVPEEDRNVIVKNGIPGQKIRFCVNKFRKGQAEGRRWKPESRYVVFSRPAADACIRRWPMRSRSL